LDKISIAVPATSANMGPGFDCLGIALNIYNTVSFAVSDTPCLINITREGIEKLSHGTNNLIYRTVVRVFQELGKSMPGLTVNCHNEIPLARGLGSSSAAIMGSIMAVNELCDRPLSQNDMLELGLEIEGHPDNITPALLGGCQVVVEDDDHLLHCAVSLPPELKAVLFIPDFVMATREARKILPQQVNREDAVYNISRVALLIASLITNRAEYLKVATGDRMHQAARQSLFPAMGDIFNAALSAGALGVFLSGSGPTILALVMDNTEEIGGKMEAVAREKGISGRVKIAEPCNIGAHIVS